MKYVIHTLLLASVLAGSHPVLVAASSAAAQSSAPAADDVSAKVKARIEADPELKDNAVTVTGAGGVVTLEGEVASPLVRAKIGEVAKGTEGVTKVNNKLKLAKTK